MVIAPLQGFFDGGFITRGCAPLHPGLSHFTLSGLKIQIDLPRFPFPVIFARGKGKFKHTKRLKRKRRKNLNEQRINIHLLIGIKATVANTSGSERYVLPSVKFRVLPWQMLYLFFLCVFAVKIFPSPPTALGSSYLP